MAGMKVVEELIAAKPDMYDITVFGAEPFGNYNRIMLSPVLCGEKNIDEIMIHDLAWYQGNNITLYAGSEKEVIKIDRKAQSVYSKDGTTAQYDRLLIATGSRPYVLPIEGSTLEGVLAFRDIYDVNKMISYAKTTRRAVVLGGGLLGLEAANGLRAQGMDVTVVHSQPYLLNRQLDEPAARLLQAELESRGVKFVFEERTKVLHGDASGRVVSVEFESKLALPCDLFVMAIGVRPNIALAQSAGIFCEQGVVVDDTLQTYDPKVYAVGECVQHRGDTFGLVAPLFEQAKVCANQLGLHGVARYQTLPAATRLKVSGIHIFSVGQVNEDESCELIRFSDPAAGIYKKLLLRGGHLVGAVLYGDTDDGAYYQSLLEGRVAINDCRHALVFGRALAEQTQHADINDPIDVQQGEVA